MPPKITLYHLVNSKSTRILILLEELGLQYDLKKFDRMDNNLAPSEFENVHPIGQAPIVVIEEEGETITLAESGAIVQYLVERHGRQLMPDPADLKATAAYMYWMHFAEVSLRATC
jgi:glutathione S-transferase